MIISVASGKGGTGKTTIAVNAALSIENVQFIDCDVEEPNAHIFLKPRITEHEKAYVPVPEIDVSRCTYCGTCAKVCVYHAIAVVALRDGKKGTALVFPQLCHGCGACAALCPEKVIQEVKREIGIVEMGSCGTIEFVHGKLAIGEAMSPPLIRQVKEHINPKKTVIIDAPPGTSCPVIEAIKGSDFCVLVTEPTPFGLNDLTLAVAMVRVLKIPFAVVINRADIGDGAVESYCGRNAIPVLMRIPFDREIALLYSKGLSLSEVQGTWRHAFRELYNKIKTLYEQNSHTSKR